VTIYLIGPVAVTANGTHAIGSTV